MSKSRVLSQGQELSDKTGKSLDRTRKLALQTGAVAENIDQRLQEQSEQLRGVHAEFDGIDTNITRSKKVMGQLVRSYAQDRCLQVLCAVISLCVIVMVVLSLTSSAGGSVKNYVEPKG